MPAIGLSTYRWNNNLKSLLLLAAFPFLLLILFGILMWVYGWTLTDLNGVISPARFADHGLAPVPDGGPTDFAREFVAAWWWVVFAGAAIWVGIGYLFNDVMIHAAAGAKPLSRLDAPQLYAIMENLCISRGLAVPRLYIMDTDAMNAFASGLDQRTFSVTVTRGLLERLNDKELEAVLAHELTHIINRDVRLMIVAVVFTGMISFLTQMLWRNMTYASYRQDRDRGKGSIFPLIAGVLAMIGYVLALILRFAISRKREYLADAGSLELTKDPEALISALRKISANPDVPHVPSEVRQMFIENPPHMDFTELFATHPPIADRIRVLEQLGGVHPEPPAQPLSPPAHPQAHGPWNQPLQERGPWGPHDRQSPPHDDPSRGPWGPHSS